MTTTVTAPKVIASHNVQALAQGEWFAFTGNPYHSHLKATPLVYAVQVKETIHGEFYVSTCYAPGVAQVHAFDPGYRSNAFSPDDDTLHECRWVGTGLDGNHFECQHSDTLPLCALVKAKAEANRVWLYLRDEFVSEFGARALTTVAVDHQGLVKGRTWIGDSFGGTCPLPDGTPAYSRDTMCPECQHFGTLHMDMLPYGNQTTCDACTYSSYVSIGD